MGPYVHTLVEFDWVAATCVLSAVTSQSAIGENKGGRLYADWCCALRMLIAAEPDSFFGCAP